MNAPVGPVALTMPVVRLILKSPNSPWKEMVSLPSPPEMMSAPGSVAMRAGSTPAAARPVVEIAVDLRVDWAAEAAPEQIVACLAEELVLAPAADDRVIAVAAEADIGACAHGDEVIAETAEQRVVARAAVDGVITNRADNDMGRRAGAWADERHARLAVVEELGADVAAVLVAD